MKQVLGPCLFAVFLCSAPLAAQEDRGEPSLMEQGMSLFLRGLMAEMEPALDELEGFTREMQPALRNFLSEMGPALRGLLTEVEDWSLYHAPEMLPNGDIIIRRRTKDSPVEPNEIEL
jgi:hypothetical protein